MSYGEFDRMVARAGVPTAEELRARTLQFAGVAAVRLAQANSPRLGPGAAWGLEPHTRLVERHLPSWQAQTGRGDLADGWLIYHGTGAEHGTNTEGDLEVRGLNDYGYLLVPSSSADVVRFCNGDADVLSPNPAADNTTLRYVNHGYSIQDRMYTEQRIRDALAFTVANGRPLNPTF